MQQLRACVRLYGLQEWMGYSGLWKETRAIEMHMAWTLFGNESEEDLPYVSVCVWSCEFIILKRVSIQLKVPSPAARRGRERWAAAPFFVHPSTVLLWQSEKKIFLRTGCRRNFALSLLLLGAFRILMHRRCNGQGPWKVIPSWVPVTMEVAW